MLTTLESGPTNRLVFLQAPSGALIEIVSDRSPQPDESPTPLRRWVRPEG